MKTTTQSELLRRYDAMRNATRSLIEGLSAEDCTVQSMTLARPIKWHLAHTSWFFETFILERAVESFRPFDPSFRVLFNSYYNSIGEQYSRPDRGLLTRPGLDRVLEYRDHVDRGIRACFEQADEPVSGDQRKVARVLPPASKTEKTGCVRLNRDRRLEGQSINRWRPEHRSGLSMQVAWFNIRSVFSIYPRSLKPRSTGKPRWN